MATIRCAGPLVDLDHGSLAQRCECQAAVGATERRDTVTSPLDELTAGTAPSPSSAPHADAPPPRPISERAVALADRIAAGKALRDTVPRTAHARWKRHGAESMVGAQDLYRLAVQRCLPTRIKCVGQNQKTAGF